MTSCSQKRRTFGRWSRASLVFVFIDLTVGLAIADQRREANKGAPSGGVTFGGFINPQDLPYDDKVLLVESGAQNLAIPELEAKAARGESLTDREKNALRNLRKSNERQAYLNVRHDFDPEAARRMAERLAGPEYIMAAEDVRAMTAAGQHQFVDYLVSHVQSSGTDGRAKALQALATLANLVHLQARRDAGYSKGWSQDLFAHIESTAKPIFLQAVQDSDPNVRTEGIKGLTYLGISASTEGTAPISESAGAPPSGPESNGDASLRRALHDADARVRFEAVQALASRSNPVADSGIQVADAMVAAMRDKDDRVRGVAAFYLSRIGEKGTRFVPTLIDIAKASKDRQQQGQVSQALRGIGTPEALSAAKLFGSPTYLSACGGPDPKTLMNQLSVSATVMKGKKRETVGRLAGWYMETVNVSVNNRNSAPVTLASMSCSRFEFWKTDNLDVEVYGWTCLSNVPAKETIKAGESTSVQLPLAIRDEKPRTFRVGFSASLVCDEQDRRRGYEQDARMFYYRAKLHQLEPSVPPPAPEPETSRVVWSPPITVN